MTKEVTVREFIDAIEKNGLPQVTHYLFGNGDGEVQFKYIKEIQSEYDKIVEACAFGQGLINLGISIPDGVDLDPSDESLIPLALGQRFYKETYGLNDHGHSIFDIARLLRIYFEDEMDKVLGVFDEFDYTPYIGEDLS